MKFSTKAENLEHLAKVLKSAKILPQVRFTAQEWQKNSKPILEELRKKKWLEEQLIVRSSARGEDHDGQSLAGHYVSVSHVLGENALRAAVGQVLDSYAQGNDSEQIFVQPMLKNVKLSGVAFSKDPNTNSPYIVINYDDTTGSTSSVSSGHTNMLRTFYTYKLMPGAVPAPLKKVVALIRELERIYENDSLDIEFAVTKDGKLFLFQVRPLKSSTSRSVPDDIHRRAVENIHNKIKEAQKPHPYLPGLRPVFGIMPDWNPAEIIGVRPRPLAMSLYKELITDNIWAYQRDNYGYKNLRSFPLMIHFCGLPYIDVRVSFNSFVPADIDPHLTERLVNHYLDRLLASPGYHDKVEFEIVYSCYTLDLPKRLTRLRDAGFSEKDCDRLKESLRKLTNRIIHGKTGLWQQDREKINQLHGRIHTVMESSLDDVSKIYWLMEDCKRYGTLPFAGLARAGFIAVQILQSIVSVGIISRDEYLGFMSTLDSVSSRMVRDFSQMDKESFLREYGHLRPGTYDILSCRYDETPERYFRWGNKGDNHARKIKPFHLSGKQLKEVDRLLREHNLEHDAEGLFDFIRAAIEGREYAKFVFTRSLSNMLSLFKKLAGRYGYDVEQCSFTDIQCIKDLYASSGDIPSMFQRSMEVGRGHYQLTQQIILPAIITSPNDVLSFHQLMAEPNFITLSKATGPAAFVQEQREKLKGSILFIPSADPGFDWIFSCGINGFITMYGGVNSHMAIRAGELGIPAVIGAGEKLYSDWAKGHLLEIDCSNKRVRVLK